MLLRGAFPPDFSYFGLFGLLLYHLRCGHVAIGSFNQSLILIPKAQNLPIIMDAFGNQRSSVLQLVPRCLIQLIRCFVQPRKPPADRTSEPSESRSEQQSTQACIQLPISLPRNVLLQSWLQKWSLPADSKRRSALRHRLVAPTFRSGLGALASRMSFIRRASVSCLSSCRACCNSLKSNRSEQTAAPTPATSAASKG